MNGILMSLCKYGLINCDRVYKCDDPRLLDEAVIYIHSCLEIHQLPSPIFLQQCINTALQVNDDYSRLATSACCRRLIVRNVHVPAVEGHDHAQGHDP